jgi:hypothetical protein
MSKSNKEPKRPRNQYILFNQEWGPVISDQTKIVGGNGEEYRKKMSQMWSEMKDKDTNAYQEYLTRSKREQQTYARKTK